MLSQSSLRLVGGHKQSILLECPLTFPSESQAGSRCDACGQSEFHPGSPARPLQRRQGAYWRPPRPFKETKSYGGHLRKQKIEGNRRLKETETEVLCPVETVYTSFCLHADTLSLQWPPETVRSQNCSLPPLPSLPLSPPPESLQFPAWKRMQPFRVVGPEPEGRVVRHEPTSLEAFKF